MATSSTSGASPRAELVTGWWGIARKSQTSTHVGGVKRGTTRFEYVHVMIDDYTRLAYAEVLPTLTTRCAIEFLQRGMTWFAERGVQIKAVMSDNGSAYKAHAYRQALAALRLRHIRTRPYWPRTNGKASSQIESGGPEASSSSRSSSTSDGSTTPVYTSRSVTSRPRSSKPSTLRKDSRPHPSNERWEPTNGLRQAPDRLISLWCAGSSPS